MYENKIEEARESLVAAMTAYVYYRAYEGASVGEIDRDLTEFVEKFGIDTIVEAVNEKLAEQGEE